MHDYEELEAETLGYDWSKRHCRNLLDLDWSNQSWLRPSIDFSRNSLMNLKEFSFGDKYGDDPTKGPTWILNLRSNSNVTILYLVFYFCANFVIQESKCLGGI